jgi:hypothetical protein
VSAHIVAVTALLTDVLAGLDGRQDLTPAEAALHGLLWPQLPKLLHIRQVATAEMQALAPALLAQPA